MFVELLFSIFSVVLARFRVFLAVTWAYHYGNLGPTLAHNRRLDAPKSPWFPDAIRKLGEYCPCQKNGGVAGPQSAHQQPGQNVWALAVNCVPEVVSNLMYWTFHECRSSLDTGKFI